MKTFRDLKFGPHPNGNGKAARLFFPNGYGVSVVRFKIGGYLMGSYTTDDTEWELAVLKGTEDEWDLCYTTPITDDVIGHLKASDVTKIMKKVQKLKK